jgi:hypothetical protein
LSQIAGLHPITNEFQTRSFRFFSGIFLTLHCRALRANASGLAGDTEVTKSD